MSVLPALSIFVSDLPLCLQVIINSYIIIPSYMRDIPQWAIHFESGYEPKSRICLEKESDNQPLLWWNTCWNPQHDFLPYNPDHVPDLVSLPRYRSHHKYPIAGVSDYPIRPHHFMPLPALNNLK